MVRKVSAIPNRLKNVSKQHPYVAGAVDIYDDRMDRNQQDINEDTYRKDEVYNKEETNNIISRTPETDVVVLNLGEEEDPLDVLDEIPASDRPNKLFRIRNAANTHYDEYGWTGEVWSLLASKDYGIDDDLNENSDNMVKNSGISKYVNKAKDNTLFNTKFALADRLGNPFMHIDDNNTLRIFVDVLQEKVNDVFLPFIDNDVEGCKLLFVDKTGNVIYGITENDTEIGKFIEYNVDNESVNVLPDTVFKENERKNLYLLNDSLFGTMQKRTQLLVVTDTHGNTDAFRNAIAAGKYFPSIDAVIHLGDSDTYVPSSVYGIVAPYIKVTEVPFFFVMGNHEVGTHESAVHLCQDRKALYKQYIEPNLRFFAEGEYPVIQGYEYPLFYFHDFVMNETSNGTSIRLIVLDCYDASEDFDTTYWKPIDYNADYAALTYKQYNSGEKVNVDGYDRYSFEAVQPVTISKPRDKFYDGVYDYYPKYKAQRYLTWYSQQQLEWFCNVLKSTPPGYNVIIAQHETALSSMCYHNDTDTRFSNYKNKYFRTEADLVKTTNEGGETVRVSVKTPLSRYAKYMHDGSVVEIPDINDERTDETSLNNSNIIARIVNAWKAGGNISFSFNAAPHYYRRTYRGITHDQYDDCSGMEVNINTDFDSVADNDVIFISGHNHVDGAIVSDLYGLREFKFMSGVVENNTLRDIIRPAADEPFMDILTALTFYKNTSGKKSYVHLTRIGADITDRVDPDTNKLISKDNEIIEI